MKAYYKILAVAVIVLISNGILFNSMEIGLLSGILIILLGILASLLELYKFKVKK